MPPAAPLAVLDLGTAKTVLAVCEERDGELRYLAHGEVESRGLRKGQVVQLDFATAAVKEAAAVVEAELGFPLERVFLSLTGAQPIGMASQAGVALASRSREVTREDTRRALELARELDLPSDREMLHVLPQEFVLDGQGGVRDPVGMLASRLEARVFILTVAAVAQQNAVLVANRAGLEVEEMIFAPLASAEILLRAEDREMGVAVVDIGAGSTSWVAYLHGMPFHAAAIPVGGEHFTNDLAIAFNIPREEAERIKLAFGCATAEGINAATLVETPSLAGRPARELPQRRICDCLESRARELTQLVRDELARTGLLRAMGAGIYLTGGGGKLAGFAELLEAELAMPVRMATPELVHGMPAKLAAPEYSFVDGACYYAHRVRYHRAPPQKPWERWL
ncbi:MAG: cell division protein FtsA, partial [Terriglobales bacterium]